MTPYTLHDYASTSHNLHSFDAIETDFSKPIVNFIFPNKHQS